MAAIRRGKRRSRARRTRYMKKNTIPRDALGFHKTIRQFDPDVYTTTVACYQTGAQMLTQDAGDATMFKANLPGTYLFPQSRGFVNLQDRFQAIMIHSAYLDVTLSNHAAGANSSVIVGYNSQLSGQVMNPSSGFHSFEASGSKTRTLTAASPRARFKLTGSLLNESYASAISSGYVYTDLSRVYIASGNVNGSTLPNVFFGALYCYSPAFVLTGANSINFKFTFRISFAVPQVAPAA